MLGSRHNTGRLRFKCVEFRLRSSLPRSSETLMSYWWTFWARRIFSICAVRGKTNVLVLMQACVFFAHQGCGYLTPLFASSYRLNNKNNNSNHNNNNDDNLIPLFGDQCDRSWDSAVHGREEKAGMLFSMRRLHPYSFELSASAAILRFMICDSWFLVSGCVESDTKPL